MMKWLKSTLIFVSFFVIITFAYLGMFYTGNFIHEASHRWDMKHIADDGYICVLEIPDFTNVTWKEWMVGKVATYNYWVNDTHKEELESIREFTEYKAYSLDIVLFAVFTFFMLVVIIKVYGDELIGGMEYVIGRFRRKGEEDFSRFPEREQGHNGRIVHAGNLGWLSELRQSNEDLREKLNKSSKNTKF